MISTRTTLHLDPAFTAKKRAAEFHIPKSQRTKQEALENKASKGCAEKVEILMRRGDRFSETITSVTVPGVISDWNLRGKVIDFLRIKNLKCFTGITKRSFFINDFFNTSKEIKNFCSDNCRVLSLQEMILQRGTNLELVTSLLSKKVGHLFSTKGFVTTPSRKKIDLEGFNSPFTVSFMFESLERTKSIRPLKTELISYIQDNLSTYKPINTNGSVNYFMNLIDEILRKNFSLFSSGFNGHGTFVGFMKSSVPEKIIIFLSNRGFGSINSGLMIREIGISKLTLENIKVIVCSDKRKSDGEWASETWINENLRGKLVCNYPLSNQKVGNCTYANLKPVVRLLTALYNNKGSIEEALEATQQSYKELMHLDRLHTLQDLFFYAAQNNLATAEKKLIWDLLVRAYPRLSGEIKECAAWQINQLAKGLWPTHFS